MVAALGIEPVKQTARTSEIFGFVSLGMVEGAFSFGSFRISRVLQLFADQPSFSNDFLSWPRCLT